MTNPQGGKAGAENGEGGGGVKRGTSAHAGGAALAVSRGFNCQKS